MSWKNGGHVFSATAALVTVVLTAAMGTAVADPAPNPTQGPAQIRPNTVKRAPRAVRPLPPHSAAVASKLAGWAKAQRSADQTRRTRPRAATVTRRATGPAAAPRLRLAETGEPTTLVLYDTAGPYGALGELYATAAANLAGHFGPVTAEPVSSYTAGQVDQHTATIYVGSTYYGGAIPDAVPAAFYSDVMTTARPVVWINNNIWNLAGHAGSAAFAARYGWDPTSSYFAPGGSVGDVTRVDYKTRALTRTLPAGTDGGVLHPHILTGGGHPAVTELAEAVDTSTSPAGRFPWAIRSANLTYLGEIPFTYTRETDRVLAFADLLFDVLAPATPERHRALLRLDDINPTAGSHAAELRATAEYLKSRNIPYGFSVTPAYTDPLGAYSVGNVPQGVPPWNLPQSVTEVIEYMLANGGTMVGKGHTHQYGAVRNPYTGATPNDHEFFRAHLDADARVILDGPVPEDSAAFAADRVTAAKAAFTSVGLPVPILWSTPNYAASATDYGVFGRHYAARYERSLYFAGVLSGQPVDAALRIGQFFPYPVRDVYGSAVIPENLGNYGAMGPNSNEPPRTAADLINAAGLNLAVRDGFASFVYNSGYGLPVLEETIDGMSDLGYTFVAPDGALPEH
ncbi:DUF2334 domain-containing protein [Actinomadura sp. HBU206391]|uniref:DUF2334 domain-containing protein n=1 Tax=Actinomadura sp. HBU206391 TaxID=2731692 RepID=UPI001C9BEA58|nr:DUF2334 domain-containing protein [Actinomadura sp. HBU206391]